MNHPSLNGMEGPIRRIDYNFKPYLVRLCPHIIYIYQIKAENSLIIRNLESCFCYRITKYGNQCLQITKK